METTMRYSDEVRERALWVVAEQQAEHGLQWAAIRSIRAKLDCAAESLRRRVRQAERNRGYRTRMRSSERERLKAPERDNRELKRTMRSCATLRLSGARPPTEVMVAFVDRYRDTYGVVVDLCAAGDRPVDVLRTQGAASAAGALAGTCAPQCRALAADLAQLAGELLRLRGEDDLAADETRALLGCTLHGRAADEEIGLARGGTGHHLQAD